MHPRRRGAASDRVRVRFVMRFVYEQRRSRHVHRRRRGGAAAVHLGLARPLWLGQASHGGCCPDRPSGGFQPPANVIILGHLLAHHPHGWFVPAMYGKESTTEALAEAGSSSSFKTRVVSSGTKRKMRMMIGKTTSQYWRL